VSTDERSNYVESTVAQSQRDLIARYESVAADAVARLADMASNAGLTVGQMAHIVVAQVKQRASRANE
jgi:hypothetical protein